MILTTLAHRAGISLAAAGGLSPRRESLASATGNYFGGSHA